MKPITQTPTTYLGLVNRFWKINETAMFSQAAISLYFSLLNYANKTYWQDAFYYSDLRLRASVGINSQETFRKARRELKNAGLIDFRAGGKGKGVKSFYTVTGANLETILSKKTAKEIVEEVQAHQAETPSPITEPEQQIEIQPQPKEEKPRNTDGLLRFLDEIHATKEDAELILELSNRGEIGHAVWKYISEVRGSNGAIKKPARFIISRLTA